MSPRSVNTIARTLIQTVVRQKLNAIKSDPERSLRNLVDMGLSFAVGGEQKRFCSRPSTPYRMKTAPITASSTIWRCMWIPST